MTNGPASKRRDRRREVLSSIRRRLLSWYRHHRRDLPWRRTQDPYAVWVSEIMLQQTTVATAGPFFERWMKRFPAVEDLAGADEQEVLSLWAGLGYYNRAKNLHRAAQELMEERGGEIPDDVGTLMSLPGIGRYTAGAIASIAFGKRVPIVDANVTRVIARLFTVREEASSTIGQRVLWEHAYDLAQTSNPGDLNQALMELGALICSPTKPQCAICPLKTLCRAQRRSNPEAFPVLKEQRETEEVTEVGAAIEREGRWLILKRAQGNRMGGMWEFPHAPVRGTSPREALPAMIRDTTGLEAEVEEPLTTIDYTFTHHRITLHVWRASATGGRVHRPGHDDHCWVNLPGLAKRPMATAHRRIAQALLETAGGRQLDLLSAQDQGG